MSLFGPKPMPFWRTRDTMSSNRKTTHNFPLSVDDKIRKVIPKEILNKIYESKTQSKRIQKKLEIISQAHHYNNVLIYESGTAIHRMLVDLYNLGFIDIPKINDSFKENLIIMTKQKDNVKNDVVAIKNIENFEERFIKDVSTIRKIDDRRKGKSYKKSKKDGDLDKDNHLDDIDKNSLKFNKEDSIPLFDPDVSPYAIITMSAEKYKDYCEYMVRNKVKTSKDKKLYTQTEEHGFVFKIVVSLNMETVNVRGEDNISKIYDSIQNFGRYAERQNVINLKWGESKPSYASSDSARGNGSVTLMTRNRKIINALKLYGFKNATLSIAENAYIKDDSDFDEIFS